MKITKERFMEHVKGHQDSFRDAHLGFGGEAPPVGFVYFDGDDEDADGEAYIVKLGTPDPGSYLQHAASKIENSYALLLLMDSWTYTGSKEEADNLPESLEHVDGRKECLSIYWEYQREHGMVTLIYDRDENNQPVYETEWSTMEGSALDGRMTKLLPGARGN